MSKHSRGLKSVTAEESLFKSKACAEDQDPEGKGLPRKLRVYDSVDEISSIRSRQIELSYILIFGKDSTPLYSSASLRRLNS